MIEPELRSMIVEHARAVGSDEWWIGCCGNFTIERILLRYLRAGTRFHSNDVSIYTTILGRYLAGEPTELVLRPERTDLAWLEPYLSTEVDRVAVLLISTRMLEAFSKDNAYWRRMREGWVRQFPTVHAKTVAKVEANTLQLASYHCMDVVDFLHDMVPKDAALVTFPPYFTAGYENMWRPLEEAFEWTPPTYEVLDEAGVKAVLDKIMDRKHWFFASNHRWEDDRFEQHLRGLVQTEHRRVPSYVYASTQFSHVVRPRDEIGHVPSPRIGPGDRIGDTIYLAPLTFPQFYTLRAQNLNPGIRAADPAAAWAVMSDGMILGVFGTRPSPMDRASAFLLCDFAIGGSDYPRLSKLVVMAACSAEARLLMERVQSRRMTEIETAVFSDNPNSMKYRSVLQLISRAEMKPDAHGPPPFKYQLRYGGDFGKETLAQALARWKQKWGQTR